MAEELSKRDRPSCEETERQIAHALAAGYVPSDPAGMRFEDFPTGRVLYANEDSSSDVTVFFMHGGGFMLDFTPFHRGFMKMLLEGADVTLVAVGYKTIPFGTYREALDLILPLYRGYVHDNPRKKTVFIGDSCGATIALSVIQMLRSEGERVPDEIILVSPWTDLSMTNPDIEEYAKRDPWMTVPWLSVCGRHWIGDLDIHDPLVSPMYGDFSGLRNVLVFTGTAEVLYPDTVKFFGKLDRDPSNEIVIAEGLTHDYAIHPIPEGEDARRKMFERMVQG